MDDWVLDSLVGFLKSPTWTIPRNSFTDNNCVVFDPGEENKFSYTDIHKEYNKLVETLLESFTSDLGISGDQFTHACSQMMTSKIGLDNEELFEQVLAADDFLLFKSIMVRRNIDLELQALKLLKNQTGHSPISYNKSSTPGDTSSDDLSGVNRVQSQKDKEEEDEKILREAVKLSEEQYRLECSMEDEELQRLIEQAKQESLEMYRQQQHLQSFAAEQRQVIVGVGESVSKGASEKSFESTVASISTKSEEDSTMTAIMGLEITTTQIEDKRREGEDGASIAEQSNITSLADAPQITPPTATTTVHHHNGGDDETEREATAEPVERNRIADTQHLNDLLTSPHTADSDREHSQSSLSPSREGAAAEDNTTVLEEISAGSSSRELGGSNDSDAMVRWLEVAKANSTSDATNEGAHSPATEANSTDGPTPEQLRAREIYLKKQRDHLLEVTKKQRKQALQNTASATTTTTFTQRSSSTQQPVTGEGSGDGVDDTRDRGGRRPRARDTGILSSTIASNLKKN